MSYNLTVKETPKKQYAEREPKTGVFLDFPTRLLARLDAARGAKSRVRFLCEMLEKHLRDKN